MAQTISGQLGTNNTNSDGRNDHNSSAIDYLRATVDQLCNQFHVTEFELRRQAKTSAAAAASDSIGAPALNTVNNSSSKQIRSSALFEQSSSHISHYGSHTLSPGPTLSSLSPEGISSAYSLPPAKLDDNATLAEMLDRAAQLLTYHYRQLSDGIRTELPSFTDNLSLAFFGLHSQSGAAMNCKKSCKTPAYDTLYCMRRSMFDDRTVPVDQLSSSIPDQLRQFYTECHPMQGFTILPALHCPLTMATVKLLRPYLPSLITRLNWRSFQEYEATCLAWVTIVQIAPHLRSDLIGLLHRTPQSILNRLHAPDIAHHMAKHIFYAAYELHALDSTLESRWDLTLAFDYLVPSTDTDIQTRLYAALLVCNMFCFDDAFRAKLLEVSLGTDTANALKNHELLQLIARIEVASPIATIFSNDDNAASVLIEQSSSIHNVLVGDHDLKRSQFELGGLWHQFNCQRVNDQDSILHTAFESKNKHSICPHILPFFTTPSIHESFRDISLALRGLLPIIVQGHSGCGKTSMIKEIARRAGHLDDLVVLHLDDQIDSKTLIGTYNSTDIPGQFEWRPGALTRAVISGHWCIIEDIDNAPFDVLSDLMTLFEQRQISIPAQGGIIRVHPDFRLFATRSVPAAQSHTSPATLDNESGPLLNSHFVTVCVADFSSDDLRAIMAARFTSIPPLLHDRCFRSFILFSRNPNLNVDSIPNQMASTRDFFRFCERINVFLPDLCQQYDERASNTRLFESIFLFAAQVFAAPHPNVLHQSIDNNRNCSSNCHDSIYSLAEIWQIDAERLQYFLTLYRPNISVTNDQLCIGSCCLSVQRDLQFSASSRVTRTFGLTKQALRLLESIVTCVSLNEPVLLVGETGLGKSAAIQFLASQCGQSLFVQNLNQQSDSADLLGGYKPVDVLRAATPLVSSFSALFPRTFSRAGNKPFLDRFRALFEQRQWTELCKAMVSSIAQAERKLNTLLTTDASDVKRAKLSAENDELVSAWRVFASAVMRFSDRISRSRDAFVFAFEEGMLVQALKHGHWLLLDEINLATSELLERLSGLLDASDSSISLTERGDIAQVFRHPNFRVFAAMNPATDFGKKDLPPGFRTRFSELYVQDVLDRTDLEIVCRQHLSDQQNALPLDGIISFYLDMKLASQKTLLDGSGHHPHYSLRSLVRSLVFCSGMSSTYGFARALYEGLCMTFITPLSTESANTALAILRKHLPFANQTLLKQPVPVPTSSAQFVQLENFNYWLQRGPCSPSIDESFILTDSIVERLQQLLSAVAFVKFPLLLQGPTSAGKTSVIAYLAKRLGHNFVRINNHEHTDLQEYLGSYVSDSTGRLVFQEGALVQAVRHGHWIVLDELNLAPSEVLEALNRLLDDNRELYVPELQASIQPHPNFMLFATQNPAGLYGGRKVLSKAFINRFIVHYVNDIPESELQTILERRYSLPPSTCKLMVAVMRSLEQARDADRVFAGKHSLITPRDLFRWANRCLPYFRETMSLTGISRNELVARSGYMLLGERLRSDDAKHNVKQVLEAKFKCTISEDDMYSMAAVEDMRQVLAAHFSSLLDTSDRNRCLQGDAEASHVAWTFGLRRMFVTCGACLLAEEPVLLVGETGCGKTSACQLLSATIDRLLRVVNCHQNTESSDFLGGLHPVRHREPIRRAQIERLQSIFASKALCSKAYNSETDYSMLVDLHHGVDKELLTFLSDRLDQLTRDAGSEESLSADLKSVISQYHLLLSCHQQQIALFEWADGPLVSAMKSGDLFLIDEISLAEDAVLERLNSVLEPSRTLLLAEKGGSASNTVVAAPGFRVFATMNPGGDFGKKELSPALRNRFTEIWVAPLSRQEDIEAIVVRNIEHELHSLLVRPLVHFYEWFHKAARSRFVFSLRDLLLWARFISAALPIIMHECSLSYGDAACSAFLHGLCLCITDGLGMGTSEAQHSIDVFRLQCFEQATILMPTEHRDAAVASISSIERITMLSVVNNDSRFGISPFIISRYTHATNFSVSFHQRTGLHNGFSFSAQTVLQNMLRLLRALVLSRSIMIEGNPGVGKSTLVQALADCVGQRLVRINLSEQTDMMDLLGMDMPVPGHAGKFEWSDGVLLQALQAGYWVLLDELNLASQSVLEGLNALLDHRATVYIPELDKSFTCPSSFRIFAAQNPMTQGGGRKGLPASFLNRFTKVYAAPLLTDDVLAIVPSIHLQVPEDLVYRVVKFSEELYDMVVLKHKFGAIGQPWEFNLRDLTRWCSLFEAIHVKNQSGSVDISSLTLLCTDLVYAARFRSREDQLAVINTVAKTVGLISDSVQRNLTLRLSNSSISVGFASLPRLSNLSLKFDECPSLTLILRQQLSVAEYIMHCIGMRWPVLLTGRASTGKSTLIKTLARLSGNYLHCISLTKATDATDLLGAFEQSNLGRCWSVLASDTKAALKCIGDISLRMCVQSKWSHEVKHLIEDVRDCHRLLFATSLPDSSCIERALLCLCRLSSRYESEFRAMPHHLNPSILLATCQKLTRQQQAVVDSSSGSFEWLDGTLIQALERGHWVLFDNANFCSPSVLDRLNPLFEPNGELLVNECGLVNGLPRLIRPHPNFRVFLTMDPFFGELSRAMRNRCIELSMVSDESQPVDGVAAADVFDASDVGIINHAISEQMPPIVLHFMVQPTSISITHRQHWLRRLALFHVMFALAISQGSFSVRDALNAAARQTHWFEFDVECVLEMLSRIPLFSFAIQGQSRALALYTPFRFTEPHIPIFSIIKHASFIDTVFESKSVGALSQPLCAFESLRTLYCFTVAMRSLIARFGPYSLPLISLFRTKLLLFTSHPVDFLLKPMQAAIRFIFARGSESFFLNIHRLSLYTDRMMRMQGELSFYHAYAASVDHDSPILAVIFDEHQTLSMPQAQTIFLRTIMTYIAQLDEFLLEFIVTGAEACLSQICQLFIERDAFVDLLILQPQISSAFVAIRLRYLHKLVLTVFSAYLDDKKISQPIAQLSLMKEKSIHALNLNVDGWHDASDVLWKRLGHPLLPPSFEYWHLKEQLIADDKRLNGALLSIIVKHSDRSELDLLFESRKTLVAALATTFAASTTVNVATLVSAHLSIFACLDKFELQHSTETTDNFFYNKLNHIDTAVSVTDVLSSAQLVDGVLLSRSISSCRLLFNQILTRELVELVLNGRISSKSMPLLHIERKLTQLLSDTIQTELHIGLSTMCWRSRHLATLQHAVWILESMGSVDDSISTVTLQQVGFAAQLLGLALEFELQPHCISTDYIPHDARSLYTAVITTNVSSVICYTDTTHVGQRDAVQSQLTSLLHALLRNHSGQLLLPSIISSQEQFGDFASMFDEAAMQLRQILLAFVNYFPSNSRHFIASTCAISSNISFVEEIFHPALFDAADGCLDSRFRQTAPIFLHSAYDIVKSIKQDKNVRIHNGVFPVFAATGFALLLAVLKFHLLIPARAVDRNERYILLASDADLKTSIAKLECDVTLIENVHAVGYPNSEVVEHAKSLRSSFENVATYFRKKASFRPTTNVPDFVTMHAFILAFSQSIMGCSKIVSLVQDLGNDCFSRDQASSAATLWLNNAYQFISRLYTDYAAYDEFTTPLTEALLRACHAMSVLIAECTFDRASCSNVDILRSLLRYPFSAHVSLYIESKWLANFTFQTWCIPTLSASLVRPFLIASFASEFELNGSIRSGHTLFAADLLPHALELVAAWQNLCGKGHPAALHIVDNTIMNCCSLWQLQETRIEKMAAEQASLYEYKTKTFGVDQTDDERLDRSVAEFFPSYEEEWIVHSVDDNDKLLLDSSSTNIRTSMSNQVSNDTIPIAEGSAFNDHQMLKVLASFLSIFSPTDEQQLANSTVSWSETNIRSLFIGYQMIQASPDSSPYRHLTSAYDAYFMLGHVASVAHLMQTLEHAPHSHFLLPIDDWVLKAVNTTHITTERLHNKRKYWESMPDVWREQNIAELRLLCAPLTSLVNRVTVLLEDWPSHAILCQIRDTAHKLLQLPLSSSLMRALTGLEALLRVSEQWESYAAKHVSIKEHIDHIFALVARWRKMELESWPKALAYRQQSIQASSTRGFFQLYHLVHSSHADDVNGVDLYVHSLYSALDDYLQMATIGEFSIRMRIVAALAEQLRLEGAAGMFLDAHTREFKAKITALLLNIHHFYSQFANAVNTRAHRDASTIWQALDDQVKLHKWDLANYWSLKDCTEKSHRRLMKMARNFENVLCTPFRSILAELDAIDSNQEPDHVDFGIAGVEYEQAKSSMRLLHAKLSQSRKEIGNCKNDEFTSLSVAEALVVPLPSPMISLDSIPEPMIMMFPEYVPKHQSPWLVHRFPKSVSKLFDVLRDSYMSDSFTNMRNRTTLYIEELSVGLIDRMNTLREAGANFAMKHKAFTDTLSAARLIGVASIKIKSKNYALKTNATARDQTEANITSMPEMFENMPLSAILLDGAIDLSSDQSFKQLLCSCDQYSSRVVAGLRQMRVRAIVSHRDVRAQEVARARQYIERLYTVVAEQQQQIGKKLISLAYVSHWGRLLHGIEQHNISIRTDRQQLMLDVQSIASDSLAAVSSIFHVNHMVMETGNRHILRSRADESTIILKLQLCKERIDSLCDFWMPVMRSLPDVSFDMSAFVTWLSIAGGAVDKELCTILTQISTHIATISPGDSSSIELPFEYLRERAATLFNRCESNIAKTSNPISDKDGVAAVQLAHNTVVASFLQAAERAAISEKERLTTNNNDEDSFHINLLLKEIITIQQVLDDAIPDNICSAIPSFIQILYEHLCVSASSSDGFDVAAVCNALEPFLTIQLAGAKHAILASLLLYRALLKLLHVWLAALNRVLLKGFCRKPDEDGEDNEESPKSSRNQTLADGTGMGEGVGGTDISHQIEDEQQLEGLRDDATQNSLQHAGCENNSSEKQFDPEQGFDMEDDFDGEMHDLPVDHEDHDSDDSGDNTTEREMGDVGDKGDIVDEKVWGDSDAEEENETKEPQQQDASKLQSDAPVHGADDSELAAKQNSDDVDNLNSEPEEKQHQPKNAPNLDEHDSEDESIEASVNDIRNDVVEDAPNVDPFKLPELMDLDDELNGLSDREDPAEDATRAPENAENMGPEEPIPASDDFTEPGDNNDMSESPKLDEDNASNDISMTEDQTKSETDAVISEAEGQEDNENSAMSGDACIPLDDQNQLAERAASNSGSGGQQHNNNGDLPHTLEQPVSIHKEDAADMQANDADGNGFDNAGQSTPNGGHSKPIHNQDTQDAHADNSRLNDFGECNPYRSFGDPNKAWKQHLNRIQRSQTDFAAIRDIDKLSDDDRALEEVGGTVEDVRPEEQADGQLLVPSEELPDENVKNLPETEQHEADAMLVDENSSNDDLQHEQQLNYDKQRSESHQKARASDSIDCDPNPSDASADKVPRVLETNIEPSKSLIDGSIVSDRLQDVLSGSSNGLELATDITSMDMVRAQLERAFSDWSSGRHINKAHELWRMLEMVTAELSTHLCEQLRIILEPQIATKLKGDYRTGKRINLKKIIPYIASGYRKDKIWLRRTKPSKRAYQVMIAIDDSASMLQAGAGQLALEALAVLCRALSQLEVGEIAVVSFGDEVRLLHPFNRPFSADNGAFVVDSFHFDQQATRWTAFFDTVRTILDEARVSTHGVSENMQLVFMISDARIQQDRELIARYTRESLSKQQLLVLLIIDTVQDQRHSIVNTRSVTYPNGRMRIVDYLDDFPFPYYVILRNLRMLPEIVASALRQWFEVLRGRQG